MNKRAQALADRIEQGAAQLASYAEKLSDKEWRTSVGGKDGRPIGVIVHHVASVYPIEVDLAMTIAGGKAVAGVTWEVVADMNAKHAKDNATISKADAVKALRQNSKKAADAVRAMKDEDLDASAPFSLSFDAPVTAQFVIEDHALRHSWHHLARIRAALGH